MTADRPAPLVSVVIVAMNDEAYIAKTLESVLAQDYPNVEIHVQHGASGTDRTLEIVKSHPSVSWSSELDTGVPDAMNRGIRATRGDIVILEGGDDTLAPSAVSELVEALLKAPSAAFAYGDIDYIDSTGRPYYRLRGRAFDLDQMFWFNLVTTQSVAIRRAAVDRVGGFRPDVINADWDFYIRVGARYPTVYIPRVLAQYRVHDRSNTIVNMSKMAWSICAVADRVLADPAIVERLAGGVDRAWAGSRVKASLIYVLGNDRSEAVKCLVGAVHRYPRALLTRYGLMSLVSFVIGRRAYERIRRRGRRPG